MMRRLADRWGYAQMVSGLILSVLTICGMGWAICSYPMKWSESDKRLNRLEPEVLNTEARVTNIEKDLMATHGDMKVIIAQYQDIKDDLNYLRRNNGR